MRVVQGDPLKYRGIVRNVISISLPLVGGCFLFANTYVKKMRPRAKKCCKNGDIFVIFTSNISKMIPKGIEKKIKNYNCTFDLAMLYLF